MTRHLLVYPTLAFVATYMSLTGAARAQTTQLASEQELNRAGSDSGWAANGSTLILRAPLGQETGFKMGATSLLHVGIGAEGGYDSNVFFAKANDANAQNKVVASPLLRVIPFIEITNATRTGAVPSAVYYDLSAALTYREYFSDDPNAKAQRAFNPSVTGVLDISSGQTFSFGVSDTFVRLEDPPYQRSAGHISRDVNTGSVDLRFAPGGGRLRGVVRYTNVLDYYEDSSGYAYASTMANELLVDGSWLWLPKTALFMQVAQGFVHYLGGASQANPTNPKFDSYPLRALAGLRGLLTEKLSLQIGVGYANAFYQGGANTSGISNLAGYIELSHRPTVLTQLTLGFRHEYRNSVIGTYFDVDAVYLGVNQRVANRLSILAHGKYELRRYKGSVAVSGGTLPLQRTDNFVEAGISIDYFMQEWIYAGVGYLLLTNASSFENKDPRLTATGVDYVKHQISGRVGFIF